MVDTARRVHWFSTQMPAQPGAAFKVLAGLVSSGVNLLACSGTQRGGQVKIADAPLEAIVDACSPQRLDPVRPQLLTPQLARRAAARSA